MSDWRQTPAYSDYLTRLGWKSFELSGSHRVFVKKLPVLPLTVIKIQRLDPSLDFYSELKSLMREQRPLETDIEFLHSPTPELLTALHRLGFRETRNGALPTSTIVVDLTQDLEAVRMDFKPKTRYNLSLASRKGLTARSLMLHQIEDWKEYESLLWTTHKRIGWWWPTTSEWNAFKHAFAKQAYLTEVRNMTGELLAMGVFPFSKSSVFYWYNASTDEGRRVMAPTQVVWEAIIEARRRSKAVFDFEGINDEVSHRTRWEGFSRFKRQFGGMVHSYPKPLVKYGWLI